MVNMYAGYQGATIVDDTLGLLHWNAAEQMYEKRNVTSGDGKLYNNLDGSDGGYWLPKNWFNDNYNATTGKLTNNAWRIIALIAVIALAAIYLLRKK